MAVTKKSLAGKKTKKVAGASKSSSKAATKTVGASKINTAVTRF